MSLQINSDNYLYVSPDFKVLCVNNNAHTCDTLYCMNSIHTCVYIPKLYYNHTNIHVHVSAVKAVATCSCAT